MKKNGFTLIELLIVTVVIVTLMGIVFRLAGTGTDQKKRAETIRRMQCLENALSGYYAAFGSYPPVPLQGRSRDIYMAVNDQGVQLDENGDTDLGNAATPIWGQSGGKRICAQIEAACRAQPVAALFPLNGEKWGRALEELGKGYLSIPSGTSGNQDYNSTDWKQCQVFQFGLMSFLLPRYLFMLDGDKELYDRFVGDRVVGQWNANNRLPCLIDGTRPRKWADVQDWLCCGPDNYKKSAGGASAEKKAMLMNVASQAVCARWMPNLEGIVTGGEEFFGVKTGGGLMETFNRGGDWPNPNFKDVRSYRPGDAKGVTSGSGSYVLNCMTVYDGWGREFYYYSEPPYQSYRLWSAGANGTTYPPWLDLPSKGNKREFDAVRKCLSDDIVHMSN